MYTRRDTFRSKLLRSQSERSGVLLDLKSDPLLPSIRKAASLRLLVSKDGGRKHKLKNGGDLEGVGDALSERVMSLRSARTMSKSTNPSLSSLSSLQQAKSSLRTLKDLLDSRDTDGGPSTRASRVTKAALLLGANSDRSVLAATETATNPPSPKGGKTGSWRKFVLTPPPVPEWTPPPEYVINSGVLSSSAQQSINQKSEITFKVGSTLHRIQNERPGGGESVYIEGPEWKGGAVVKSEEARAERGQVPAEFVKRGEGREGGGWYWLGSKDNGGLVAGVEEEGWEWETRGLTFESRFESGNLRSAVRVGERKYRLLLRDDVSTVTIGPPVKPGARWFYFRISGGVKGVKYTLSLENMIKSDSLFKDGMKPLVWSRTEHEKSGRGWQRGGDNVSYVPNEDKYSKAGCSYNFHSLSFDITPLHDDDEIFLASCYPYTFSDLLKLLSRLSSDPLRAPTFVRRELAVTVAGNPCDVLVVSANIDPSQLSSLRSKPAIVISARVHPGESNASYVMQGVLEHLTGSAQNAQLLRQEYVLYLVPMLNPDGVINGNHRCSLAGQDLNRQWVDPGPKLHPTIRSLKTLLSELAASERLVLYIDLHGHSSRKGLFLYSCETSVAALPAILARRSPFFALDACTYKVARSKQCTGRAVVRSEIGCANSFTCEASMMGADLGDGSTLHFNTQHLRQMGALLCDGIAEYLLPDEATSQR